LLGQVVVENGMIAIESLFAVNSPVHSRVNHLIQKSNNVEKNSIFVFEEMKTENPHTSMHSTVYLSWKLDSAQTHRLEVLYPFPSSLPSFLAFTTSNQH
jgi:hypothetical protein